MSWLSRVISFSRHFLKRRQRENDLDEELHSILELLIEQKMREGKGPKEARRTAIIELGGVEQVKEQVRAVRTGAWLETLLKDTLFGFRMLGKSPGFTAVAVIVLSLGIGLNSAVLTAYKAMVARPLDGRNPGEMVNLAIVHSSGAADYDFSYPDYENIRDSAQSFSGVIAFSYSHMRVSAVGSTFSQSVSGGDSDMSSPGASNAEFANVPAVSENYFKVLGVSALRGRTFDSMSNSELLTLRPVLISENYWQKRLAGDPAVLGKTVSLNGVALTIVGVMPHDFVGTSMFVPNFWIPLSLAPLVHADALWLRERENQCCRLVARLAPATSMKQAQAEMNILVDNLRTLHDSNSEWAKPATALVWPGSPFPLPLNFYPGISLAVGLIMAAAAMVLAIACADLGSLQLARARSRQNEIRTRLALGASRPRIIRQLLTESAVLGLLSGILAFLLSWALLRIFANLAASALPPGNGTLIFDVNPDLEIFAYVFCISLGAGIAFGLAPAIESSGAALSSADRGSTSSARSRRIQECLIAAQVALSLALMITGGMLIRSSINSLDAKTGYDSNRVVDLDLQFPEAPKYTADHKLALIREIRTRLSALPGVAEITSGRPPGDDGLRTAVVTLDGQASPRTVESVHYTYVEGNYFQTLGIPVLVGHSFESQSGQSEHSVILSESLARQLWPGQSPVGRNIRLGATDERLHSPGELLADGPTYQIIAIARDTRGIELNGSDSRQLYLPLAEDHVRDHPILIRAEFNPSQVIRAIDPVISSIDPDLVATSSTLDEMLRLSPPFVISALSAAVASGVGLVGLLPCLMGIYGTVSYVVALRTREIGIRMAVGAQRRDILRLVLRESTRPVLAGLPVGIFVALGASYLLRGVLYGLSIVDAISFIGASFSFLVIALLAAFFPARRASCLDPMVALRHQ